MKTNIISYYFILVILLVFLCGCENEPNKKIAGTVGTENVITGAVFDEEGNPVPGAFIMSKTAYPINNGKIVALPRAKALSQNKITFDAEAFSNRQGFFKVPIFHDSVYFLKVFQKTPTGLTLYWQDSLYLRYYENSIDLGPLPLKSSAQIFGKLDSSLMPNQVEYLGILGTDVIIPVSSSGTFSKDSLYPGSHAIIVSPVISQLGMVMPSSDPVYHFSILADESTCMILGENGSIEQWKPTDPKSCWNALQHKN